MQFVALLLLLLSPVLLPAQSWGDSTIEKGPVFYSVEQAPEYPGGMKAFYQFIADNLKMPDNKFATTSDRNATVKIVLDKTGKVRYASMTKSINDNYTAVIFDMVSKMPLWKPGIQNGHPVTCALIIPLVFVSGK